MEKTTPLQERINYLELYEVWKVKIGQLQIWQQCCIFVLTLAMLMY